MKCFADLRAQCTTFDDQHQAHTSTYNTCAGCFEECVNSVTGYCTAGGWLEWNSTLTCQPQSQTLVRTDAWPRRCDLPCCIDVFNLSIRVLTMPPRSNASCPVLLTAGAMLLFAPARPCASAQPRHVW